MKKETIGKILIFIAAFGMCSWIVFSVLEVVDESIAECDQYDNVKYRIIASGGFFGGTERIITQGEIYDGDMQVCVKGKNWKGEVIIK